MLSMSRSTRIRNRPPISLPKAYRSRSKRYQSKSFSKNDRSPSPIKRGRHRSSADQNHNILDYCSSSSSVFHGSQKLAGYYHISSFKDGFRSAIGRYNSRIGKSIEEYEEIRRRKDAYECKKCATQFTMQNLYVKHIVK